MQIFFLFHVVILSLLELSTGKLSVFEFLYQLSFLLNKELSSIFDFSFNLVFVSFILFLFSSSCLICNVFLSLRSSLFAVKHFLCQLLSLILSSFSSLFPFFLSLRLCFLQLLFSCSLSWLDLMLYFLIFLSSFFFFLVSPVIVGLHLLVPHLLSLILQFSSWSIHSSRKKMSVFFPFFLNFRILFKSSQQFLQNFGNLLRMRSICLWKLCYFNFQLCRKSRSSIIHCSHSVICIHFSYVI